jgi:hypothetical protein
MPLQLRREAGWARGRIETCSPDRVVRTTHLAWPGTEPQAVGDALDPDGAIGEATGVPSIGEAVAKNHELVENVGW